MSHAIGHQHSMPESFSRSLLLIPPAGGIDSHQGGHYEHFQRTESLKRRALWVAAAASA